MGIKIVHLAGDGIGPEVTQAARRVMDATGVDIEWVDADAGEQAFERTGQVIPVETVRAVREVGLVLKGPMANPAGTGYASPNIAIRHAADLYVNVREAQTFVGAPTKFPGVELAVVRGVTEDIYTGASQMLGPDAAMAIKYVTRGATQKVMRFACEYALRKGYERVTVVHKAGTLKHTDGLFLEGALQVAAEFPSLQVDDCLIDAVMMHLIREPEHYSVLVGGFQYGDILADLAAGLVGGLGLVPGASFGDNGAFFEAAHGSAPKHAGKNRINPTALILSGAMLLEHVNEPVHAARIRDAVASVIRDGRSITYDLGGSSTLTAYTDAVIRAL